MRDGEMSGLPSARARLGETLPSGEVVPPVHSRHAVPLTSRAEPPLVRPVAGEGARSAVDASLARATLSTLSELSPVDSGLRAVPPSAHFSAWAEGESESGGSTHITVRVLNFSGAPSRITVDRVVEEDAAHPGDSDAFTVDVDAAGVIAPGLAQTFSVFFVPVRGRRYYYAAIRVRNDRGGEIRVPLHAYPVAAGFEFPGRIDFGRVELGGSVSRRVRVSTRVPLPFSVAVTPSVLHDDIQVEPAGAIIPPRGDAEFTFT